MEDDKELIENIKIYITELTLPLDKYLNEIPQIIHVQRVYKYINDIFLLLNNKNINFVKIKEPSEIKNPKKEIYYDNENIYLEYFLIENNVDKLLLYLYGPDFDDYYACNFVSDKQLTIFIINIYGNKLKVFGDFVRKLLPSTSRNSE
jgi:hypothetical protein